MAKTPKAVVESDFDYLVENLIHKKYAKQLKKQFKAGNIRFQVSCSLGLNNETGLENDGETHFGRRERKCFIKIKKSSATSERICWRRAIVCHEMIHALHYFESNGIILEGEEHGEEWKNLMISAVKDGLLQDCAKELESPQEVCIFKENKEKCKLCEPNSKINF